METRRLVYRSRPFCVAPFILFSSSKELEHFYIVNYKKCRRSKMETTLWNERTTYSRTRHLEHKLEQCLPRIAVLIPS
jgi:hypothetical protein